MKFIQHMEPIKHYDNNYQERFVEFEFDALTLPSEIAQQSEEIPPRHNTEGKYQAHLTTMLVILGGNCKKYFCSFIT